MKTDTTEAALPADAAAPIARHSLVDDGVALPSAAILVTLNVTLAINHRPGRYMAV